VRHLAPANEEKPTTWRRGLFTSLLLRGNSRVKRVPEFSRPVHINNWDLGKGFLKRISSFTSGEVRPFREEELAGRPR